MVQRILIEVELRSQALGPGLTRLGALDTSQYLLKVFVAGLLLLQQAHHEGMYTYMQLRLWHVCTHIITSVQYSV